MASIDEKQENSRKMNKLLMNLVDAYANNLNNRPNAFKSLRNKLHQKDLASHSLKK